MAEDLKAWETILPVYLDLNEDSEAQKVPGATFDKDESKCVTLDDDTAWDEFFKIQNNLTTNTTNTRKPKPFVQIDSNGMYIYTARDENKYNGKYIIGQVADKIKTEMLKNLGNDTVKSIRLKESKDEDGNVMAAARIVLGRAMPLNISNLINEPICEKYRVNSVTLCLPVKNETRGLRCRLGTDGIRVYEVANGSYEITLNWYAEGGKCTILVSVGDDGSVKILERNGVTRAQLCANKEVKVGTQYEAKFLYETLMIQ